MHRNERRYPLSQLSNTLDGAARAVSQRNRRATIRYRCAPATIGKIFSTNDQEFQRAWIIDLSLRGIGMEVSRPLEVGHLVMIAIRGHDGVTMHELTARVIHCEPLLQGNWSVGGELTAPLSADQLEQLL